MSTNKQSASTYLTRKFGPLSLGKFLKSIRLSEEISQTTFAENLNISRANLCDIEKERKLVSPERAARFAKELGYPEKLFVKLALEDILRHSKLKYHVELKAS